MGLRLAVQMYTVRAFTQTARDLERSLRRIREIGYEGVQWSAVGATGGPQPPVSMAEARRMLEDNGLRCVATHRGWDDLVARTGEEIAAHRTLGCDFVAIGSLPGRYQERGAAGYQQFLQEAAPVIAALKEAGLRFGYHHHAQEFARIGPGRRTLFDLLVAEGGADLMLEVDTYWAVHAGVDPAWLIARCRGRVPVVHLKDREVVGAEPVMAPVGEGNLNWDAILRACQQAGVEWYAVEQDVCRRDPFDCLRSSFEFLAGRYPEIVRVP
ncbi:MAG: sugar phosphate isomerase/epimerase [Chloroherpetonaceae bacterium]|nr:sugar phosphate isomerase/epimerase [Chloroherpetonaceae bacterium]